MRRFDPQEFSRSALDIARAIPYGRVSSYAAIARAVGRPTMSRMVGRVMALNGDPLVPAHRVVSSSGVLTGSPAFGPPGVMARMLEAEGVRVRNNRVQQWQEVFWDPMEEF